MTSDPDAPYDTFRLGRCVADLAWPFLPGQVVKLMCGCGFETNWYLLSLESYAAQEIDEHKCTANAS